MLDRKPRVDDRLIYSAPSGRHEVTAARFWHANEDVLVIRHDDGREDFIIWADNPRLQFAAAK